MWIQVSLSQERFLNYSKLITVEFLIINGMSVSLNSTHEFLVFTMLIYVTLLCFLNYVYNLTFRYDGQRAQIHLLLDGTVRIFSRNGDETTSKFPDLVDVIKQFACPAAETFMLDAEVGEIRTQSFMMAGLQKKRKNSKCFIISSLGIT